MSFGTFGKPRYSDTLFSSQLFYNDNNQLVRYVDKSNKGDSIEMHFEYTPSGVPKKRTRITNKPEGYNLIDYAWDANQKTILPERLISVGYPTYLTWGYITPLAPLSVKGDLKGSILYKKDKEGKLYKADEDIFSDIKSNTSGYFQEGKYKSYQSNKTFRIRAVYEGCKN